MLSISGTAAWKKAHPGAIIGLLELSGVENGSKVTVLDGRKREIEAGLAERCGTLSRQEMTALPVMSAYKRYYKRFKKTYHVQLQVESIAQKGRKLPKVSALVDANFMAELETFVLTAGHDVRQLHAPVVIDVSREGDHIHQMSGAKKPIRAGDMVVCRSSLSAALPATEGIVAAS